MLDSNTFDTIKIDTEVVMKCLNLDACCYGFFFQVKDHFLPLEYHSIFQLEVATVT